MSRQINVIEETHLPTILASNLVQNNRSENRLAGFNEKRHQSYEAPPSNETNFLGSDENYIFIDKSLDALSFLTDPEKLIFLQRPRRFGKSTFFRFMRYLCIYGLDDEKMKKKYPELNIFKAENLSKIESFKSQKYLPLYLDFACMDVADSLEHQISCFLISCVDRLITEFKKINHPKHSQMTVALSEIKDSCQSVVYPSLILEKFNKIQILDYNVILFIDEYETPLFSKLKDLHNNVIDEPAYKKYENYYQSFFTNLKSLCGQFMLSKVIMTGVISIRNIGIFSGSNSFTNFSNLNKYNTTFGFSFEELKNNIQIKDLIINLLIRHKWLEISQDKEVLEAKFEDYLRKIFKQYNGFCFTTDLSQNSSVISPISFFNHLKFLAESESNQMIPNMFKNYWSKTGSTSQISAFYPKKKDPYEYPKLLYAAENEIINEDMMDLSYDLTIDELPLTLFLFYTGYFSIKGKIEMDKLKFGWTNNETKNAFYAIYNKPSYFKNNFYNDFFSKLKNPDLNEKEVLKCFLGDLEQKFRDLHSKYYGPEQEDHEHNAIFRLFIELQVAVFVSDAKLELFDRWKLTSMNDNLTKGGVPDLILFSKTNKIVIIMEFQKESNK